MKKLLCLTLVLLMVFGLVACGGDGGKEDSGAGEFQIGFGRVDITPTEGIHLASYGDSATRIMEEALHPFYTHAVVMKGSNGKMIAVITTDMSQGSHTIMNELRPMMQERFGLEKDQVLIGGTHNHNAPDYGYADEYDQKWKDIFKNGCLDAVQQAIDDLAPATTYIGRTETENMTFVRRYYLADGNMTGDNYNYDHNSTIVAHETDADEEVQIVRFVREGDHKDILMVNWQSHAAKHGHTNNLSADYPGALRDKLDAELGVHTIFYQGACGNLNPTSRIPGEQAVTGKGYQGAVEVGEKLADYVIAALNTEGLMKKVDTGAVNYNQSKFIGQESYDETNTVSIGGLSFVTLPVEFYDSLGKTIKDETPYDMTVLLGFHCGNGQYLATLEGYKNGGYGPTNTRYVAGEGEKFVQHYLDSLNTMYKAENP